MFTHCIHIMITIIWRVQNTFTNKMAGYLHRIPKKMVPRETWGKPRRDGWNDLEEQDVRKLGVRGQRQKAEDRKNEGMLWKRPGAAVQRMMMNQQNCLMMWKLLYEIQSISEKISASVIQFFNMQLFI